MSIGKKSIARAANAAAKAAEENISAPETDNTPALEAQPPKAEEVKKTPEKFKKVSVGEKMPAFLL